MKKIIETLLAARSPRWGFLSRRSPNCQVSTTLPWKIDPRVLWENCPGVMEELRVLYHTSTELKSDKDGVSWWILAVALDGYALLVHQGT